MNKSIHVERVTLTVVMSDGVQSIVEVERPRPLDDDPWNIVNQVDAGVDDLTYRTHQFLDDTYSGRAR